MGAANGGWWACGKPRVKAQDAEFDVPHGFVRGFGHAFGTASILRAAHQDTYDVLSRRIPVP